MTAHIVHALIGKRAEIAGAIRQAEKTIHNLRADLSHVDGALALFDPTIRPADIQAVTKRAKPHDFRHGHFRRAILGILRQADAPLSARSLAERMMAENLPEIGATRTVAELTHKIRHALTRNAEGLTAREKGPGQVRTWQIDEEGMMGED